MTLRSQGQGHGGNDLGWSGARHLYFNSDRSTTFSFNSWTPSIFYLFFLYDLEISGSRSRWEWPWMGLRLLVLISGYPRFFTSFFCMTLISQGQGHSRNDLGWMGARHVYLNLDDPRVLVLISGYLWFLTSFFCMTFRCQGQSHIEKCLGRVSARHLYLNFVDPRLLVNCFWKRRRE